MVVVEVMLAVMVVIGIVVFVDAAVVVVSNRMLAFG